MVERDLTLHMSSNTAPDKYMHKPVQCKLLLHVTHHCSADPSLLRESSWVVNMHTGFLEREGKMNGLSPIIWSFVTQDDSCWFNKDCLVFSQMTKTQAYAEQQIQLFNKLGIPPKFWEKEE